MSLAILSGWSVAFGVAASSNGRHRGGRVTIERLAHFIAHQSREAERITTLVDYYGFQDRAGRTRGALEVADNFNADELP